MLINEILKVTTQSNPLTFNEHQVQSDFSGLTATSKCLLNNFYASIKENQESPRGSVVLINTKHN